MKLSKLIEIIEKFAPVSLAEDWDNVGLLVGNKTQEVSNAVVCLDITEKAYQMCKDKGAQVCICHHPFLFDATKKLDFTDPYYDLLRKFIQSDIAIYAAHTNLDACVGGVNDALSKKLDLEIVATFMPSENPFDFQKDIVPGIGRICTPKTKMTLFDFYKTVNKNLMTSGCHVNFDKDRAVNKILVVGGSYDSAWNVDVLDNNVDVVLSGEIKLRDMVYFDRYNVATIAAGHDATERAILPAFVEYLNLLVKEVEFDKCISFDYSLLNNFGQNT